MPVLSKLWKVVWHFSRLLFVWICPFRSDIVIWTSSLPASVRLYHICGYSYLEIQESEHQGVAYVAAGLEKTDFYQLECIVEQ